MRFWSHVINALLCAFAGWTLCYQLALWLHLPASSVMPLAAAFVLALGVGCRLWGIRPAGRSRQWPAAVVLLAMAGAAAVFAGANSQWNDDFFSFYYRAVRQLSQLDQPLIAADVAHTGSDLPPLSAMHNLTSWELLAALTAGRMAGDPVEGCLWWAGVPIGLMVVIHALLLRRFGLSTWLAIAGAAVSFLFLCLDLWQGRCLGAAIAGSWSGKVAHWLAATPLITLYTLRCLTRPTAARRMLLGLSSVAAVGLSGSALFMTPLQVAGICLAYLLAHRGKRRHRLNALRTLSSQAYCVGLILLLLTGVMASPRDASVWQSGWPQTWTANLALVWGTPWRLARDFAVVLALPLLALGGVRGRFLSLISACLLLVCMSPLSGPILIRMVLPGAYWRLVFLLPVTAASGLLAALLLRRPPSWPSGLLRYGGAAVLAMLVFQALDPLCLTKLSPRWTLIEKLPPDANHFHQQFADQMAGRNILAPEELSAFLPIRLPTARFEVTRCVETRHLLANAGRPEEAIRRAAAQAATTALDRTPEMVAALRAAVEGHRVDTIICANPQGPGDAAWAMASLLPGRWRLTGRTPRFLLLVADELPAEPRLSGDRHDSKIR
jgi:hypothetical protein